MVAAALCCFLLCVAHPEPHAPEPVTLPFSQLETLQAIFFEYEGGSPPPLAPQQPDCGSPAEAEAA